MKMQKWFVSAIVLAVASLNADAASVADMTWHKRLLIVFANEASSPELAKQRAFFDQAKQGYNERDLVSIEVIGQSVQGANDSADALRQKYGIAPGAFKVLLIGKDGGVKIESDTAIDTPRLFGTIDAMPMRRDEARRAPKS